MGKRKIIFWTLLMFIMTIFAFNKFNMNVKAVIQSEIPSKEYVYQHAPTGLNLGDFVNIAPTYNDNNKTTNGAQLITDYPTNIIQMLSESGSKQQVASFWGKYNDADNNPFNYFDLTKDQTFSAWLYFGDTAYDYGDNDKDDDTTTSDDNSAKQASDGMAFVLQNDNNGDQAIATGAGDKNAAFGESLGVWGNAYSNDKTSEDTDLLSSLHGSAIQNSFALEFDTVNNHSAITSKNSPNDYFDGVIDKGSTLFKGQHITAGYPGSEESYSSLNQTYGAGLLGFGGTTYYYYGLNKTGTINNNISISGYPPIHKGTDGTKIQTDDAWKHLTFTYTKPQDGSKIGSYKAVFDDKNLDGSNKPIYLYTTNTGTIDTTKLGDKSKVRWGFTAATGSQHSMPRTYSVIVQQMPNVAEVKTTGDLYDLSQYDADGNKKRQISDLYQNSSYNPEVTNPIAGFLTNAKYNVGNNDTLLFDYGLNYVDGASGTGDISAKIELPQNVDFDTGLTDSIAADSIGKVTYSGTGAKADNSYEISASDIMTDDSGKKYLNLKLDGMNTPDQKANVELYGKANAAKNPILVESESASYQANRYVGDSSSPAFIINDRLLATKTSADSQDLEYGDKPGDLTGQISYENKTKIDTNTTLYTKVNGKKVDTLGKMIISDDGLTGNFTIDGLTSAATSGSLLKVGKNTIEVYAVDSMNRASDVLEYTINVKDKANLLLTTDQTDFTTLLTDKVHPSATVKYDTDSSFYENQISWHWNVDGKEKIEKSNESNVVKEFSFGKDFFGTDLQAGTHKVTLYADDGSRNSNTITFNITVNDRTLIATADPDTESITVNDNNPVNIKGSFKFSDDSALSATSEVTYTIKNEGQDPQAPVKIKASDGKIDLTLNPILESKINQVATVDKAINDPTTPGLREGRNEVTVTVKDSGVTSNSLTYVINVPKMTPKLTTDELDVQAKKVGNIPIEFTYDYGDNSEYKLKPSGLLYFYKNNTASQWVSFNLSGDEKSTPYTFNTYLDGNNIGVTSKEPYEHKADILTYDSYGRKSNSLTYNITYIPKSLSLTVKNNYQFKDLKFGETTSADSTLERKNTWDIEVDSYKSRWKLMAEQTADFTTKDGDKMEAYLNFQDKNKNAYSLSNPTEIASDDTAPTTEEITNVGKQWGADDGILITVNSYPVPGLYQSQITWTLVDSDVV